MLRDQESRVQYMFVAQSIRTRLLMEARRQGETDEFLRAAAAVLVEPKERHKHDNHFHVRIYCPVNDRPHCQDSAPYWPWYEGAPPGGQYAELPLVRWRRASAEQPTSSPGVDPRAP
jgi:penicillin-insensitive murein endopeptidase